MKIEFCQRYKSIKHFPTVELPSFAVVVGINGSGKSHLLQALEAGNLVTEATASVRGATRPNSDVKLITASDIAPTEKAAGSMTRMLPSLRFSPSLFLIRGGVTKPFQDKLLELYLKHGLDPDLIGNAGSFGSDFPQFAARIPDEAIRKEVWKLFQQAEKSMKEVALTAPAGPTSKHGDLNPLPFALKASQYHQKSILWIEHNDIESSLPHVSDLFSINWVAVCTAYRSVFHKNELIRARDRQKQQNDALTDDEFQSLHGPAPWSELSRAIQAFGLPYMISERSIYSQDPFVFSLEHTSTGEKIEVDQLSSGESVILRFVLALSDQVNSSTLATKSPKLLLLDEVDAWLHPELIQKLVKVLQDVIVKERKIDCILSTHSPTTVALVPEEALYRMSSGLTGLTKCSKQSALNALTVGVPTVSIDFSARRHVFVESRTDAFLYGRIFDHIKPVIDPPRLLSFISSGFSSLSKAEQNGGCKAVSSIVKSMRQNQALGIYGMIDWDGVNVPEQYIYVVEPNRYHSIENVLLDPLLLSILLLKINKFQAEKLIPRDSIRSRVRLLKHCRAW